MNTEGHLKGRTNRYALRWLSGPMKGALWAGLASFLLVANIKPLPGDLTLDVMRPSIPARREGALMVNRTHTHTHTHTHTRMHAHMHTHTHIFFHTRFYDSSDTCMYAFNYEPIQAEYAHTRLSNNGLYSHLTIWIGAPCPLIKLEVKHFFSVFVLVEKKTKKQAS